MPRQVLLQLDGSSGDPDLRKSDGSSGWSSTLGGSGNKSRSRPGRGKKIRANVGSPITGPSSG
jgi:hypothetical protein